MSDMREIVQPTSGPAALDGAPAFCILGPLMVRCGNTSLELGGQRQRALLAFLLLHANEQVTNEVLVDALWGDGAARSVRTLHVAVSRLRKALEPLGPGVLDTVNGRYVLNVAHGQLDCERFAASVNEGRECYEGGDPERGARLLRSADALWRGGALDDVASRTSRRRRSGASTSCAWPRSRPGSTRSRARPSRGPDRRARGPGRGQPHARPVRGPADARALPLRAPGRRARGLPRCARA